MCLDLIVLLTVADPKIRAGGGGGVNDLDSKRWCVYVYMGAP